MGEGESGTGTARRFAEILGRTLRTTEASKIVVAENVGQRWALEAVVCWKGAGKGERQEEKGK